MLELYTINSGLDMKLLSYQVPSIKKMPSGKRNFWQGDGFRFQRPSPRTYPERDAEETRPYKYILLHALE